MTQLMSSLISLMKHNDRRIRKSAADCLVSLNDPGNIKYWGTAVVPSFWKISSQSKLAMARFIVDNRQHEDLTRTILDLLGKILLSRNNFLASIKVRTKACVFY
jgi:hypothetical protein